MDRAKREVNDGQSLEKLPDRQDKRESWQGPLHRPVASGERAGSALLLGSCCGMQAELSQSPRQGTETATRSEGQARVNRGGMRVWTALQCWAT